MCQSIKVSFKGLLKSADKALKALKEMRGGREGDGKRRKRHAKYEVSQLFKGGRQKNGKKCGMEAQISMPFIN